MRERDEAWLQHVRKQPCAGCSAYPPSEAHHFMPGRSGMGRKPDDLFTVPLCRDCHESFHQHRYTPLRAPTERGELAHSLAVAQTAADLYRAQALLLAQRTPSTGSEADVF